MHQIYKSVFISLSFPHGSSVIVSVKQIVKFSLEELGTSFFY